jgi:hypothetical protein
MMGEPSWVGSSDHLSVAPSVAPSGWVGGSLR